jgi:hypothetical protein
VRIADFVIVGAMRCGTTSLYRYLGAHPEVFIAPKELGFFTDHFTDGIEWYQQQFAAAGEGQLLGEATADYLARNSAMLRLAETLPDAKLVASLRSPTERAWSHYLLLRERRKETRSFGKALDDEMARIAADGPEAPGVIYTLHGLYDVHLERALALYPRRQIFVSVFERMVADPAASYRALCDYLGVAADFVPGNLGEPVNPYVTFRSLRVRDLSKRLPGPVGRVVARINTRRDASNPLLPDAEGSRLREFYADRIVRVEELLGEPIPEWRV